MTNIWGICVLALCCVRAGSDSALSKFQKSMTSLASSLASFERKGLEILGMEEANGPERKALHKRSDSGVKRIRIKVIHHDDDQDSDRGNGSKVVAVQGAVVPTATTFPTAGCAKKAIVAKMAPRLSGCVPATTEPTPTGAHSAVTETPNMGRFYKLASRDHLRIHIIHRPYDEEANETVEKRNDETDGDSWALGSGRRAPLRKLGGDAIPAEYIDAFQSKLRRVNESLQRVRDIPRFRKRRNPSAAADGRKMAWYDAVEVYYALLVTAVVVVVLGVTLVFKRATKRDPADPEELLPLNTVSEW